MKRKLSGKEEIPVQKEEQQPTIEEPLIQAVEEIPQPLIKEVTKIPVKEIPAT